MMRRTSRLAVIVAVFAIAACSSESKPTGDAGSRVQLSCSDAAPPGSAGSFFPCDVDAILAAKCRRCHTSQAVLDQCVPMHTCESGPFPLLVWSDTRRDLGGVRPVDLIATAISSGIMPFQSTRITPPVEPLTPAEKKTLIQWAEACAPPGATACGDAAP